MEENLNPHDKAAGQRNIIQYTRILFNKLLSNILGFSRQLDALRRERDQWQQLYQTAELQITQWQQVHQAAEAHIETFKREIVYWQQNSGAPRTAASVNNEEFNYQKNLATLHARTISALTQSNLLIQNGQHLKNPPLVSIIMPVWNRADMVHEAINSIVAQTYIHWELLLIDDGSTDETRQMIEPFLNDKRIHYHYLEHSGECVARNQGLSLSKGELIAYLDSDNLWLPHALALAVHAFVSDPECQAAYFAEEWHDYENNKKWLYFPEQLNYDDAIINHNSDDARGIEINSFVHRRGLYEQLGGFDVNLTRLTDYEFTYRYGKHTKIKPLPFLGTYYRYSYANNTLTTRENVAYNLYRIRAKHQTQTQQQPMRVLYLLDHYPQVTESYIYSEIEYMQRQGVHIEVWSEHQPITPFPTSVPIHYGTLAETIELVRPDLTHAHWLTAFRFAEEVGNFGLAMTVRSHGFEFFPERLRQLHQFKSVYAIYLYPHFFRNFTDELHKLKLVPACFNPHRYFPGIEKNRKLVLRVSAALPTKDLHLFFRVAQKCKEHQFVMVVGRCRNEKYPHFADELVQYNLSLGNPVDLRINMMPEEIAPLVQEAGIYFHTHSLPGDEHWSPFGMSISICESMATGAYIIGRQSPDIQDYIGTGGDCYASEDEAATLINATLDWQDEEWHRRQQRSLERAYMYFVDERGLSVIYHDWLTIKFLAQLPGRARLNTSAA